MRHKPVNFKEKFAQFSQHWSPKIVGQMNDYHLKVVKVKGEFVWHQHTDTDEVFIVIDGRMTIHLRDGEVDISTGEMFIVPKGIEHKPSAQNECSILLIEPAGTVNTGDAGGHLTAAHEEWI